MKYPNTTPSRRTALGFRGLIAALGVIMVAIADPGQGEPVAPLPQGVKAVWDLGRAVRETTPTRERVCINGLWRWQPAHEVTDRVPAEGWGYFKVPGCWPGITDYLQKDCQTVYRHPSWQQEKLGGITAAWYQREITVPAAWTGRRLGLHAEYLNSLAVVFVDGQKAGEMRFPVGEVDLTPVCRPGGTHILSLLVVAMPLKAVLLSYNDTASARAVKGTVERRGLCGDVYLTSVPAGARIADVKIDTSVRQGQITFDTALEGLPPDARYVLRAEMRENDGRRFAEFASDVFAATDLADGRLRFTRKWSPGKLWDLHTTKHLFHAQLSLSAVGGRLLDTASPVRFGFREFWIDGRDFYLNGTRIFLSAVPLDNAAVGAAWATYEGARESLERLKTFGINFVYTHNYGCEPGSHLSFTEVLRAADDVGMLVALSQPHFSHYDWKTAEANAASNYAHHAEFYVRVAQNHPAVVAYAMSHNATGYGEDMNPDMIDGLQDPRDQWSLNNSRLALRAEAIVKRLDPSRIVYHHSSGNLGSMHTVNFYANFAPIQELSDWFEHWATQGVKPVFLCEYGVPFSWDWTMYRGWYQGQRTFGSAKVPWEFCLAEWNAQFLGDRAYQLTEMEKANLRWEAKQFRAGNLWHRWDYPHQVGSRAFDERDAIFALYLEDNWRAFRTWGVSANSPWEHDIFWRPREGVDRSRKELPTDWDRLQRPGLSPDYLDQRYERMDLAFTRSDWIPTAAGRALIRNNRPLLAYIGGKPARFTSKDHDFCPGETVEKQIIVINNSRETVSCNCRWSLNLPQALAGERRLTVRTGDQERLPVRFDLPDNLLPGAYELSATVQFGGGETQSDSFTVNVLPRPSARPTAPARAATQPSADRQRRAASGVAAGSKNQTSTEPMLELPPPQAGGRIALFDPMGQTAKRLEALEIRCDTVGADADLSAYRLLVIGKEALAVDGPGPDLSRVRDGLKAIVFEQTPAVLEQRLGFRVAEYGMRRVFKRVPDHPLLRGIGEEQLHDWRGAASILPPRLKYSLSPKFSMSPTVTWCGLPVTRVWRCGNQGNVASVLIEKPACGHFMPILDCGYSLQYSPLLEYREGAGLILFCQTDVTGRTEDEPAAALLVRNMLSYVSDYKPGPRRKGFYAGESAGRSHLEAAGFSLDSVEVASLRSDDVLILGPGGGQALGERKDAIATWLKGGGRILAVGLDEPDANAFLSSKVRMRRQEHIAAYFEPAGVDSLLAGIGPAEVHNRDPREFNLLTGGAAVVGDGVLGLAEGGEVVLCQLAPWQFSGEKPMNIKRTYRRVSCLLTRLAANLGAPASTPLLSRFHKPVSPANPEKRWLDGLYLDAPEEWDDPYRFFRW